MDNDTDLNRFCGSKFWDPNLTWYTENPDLTPCFQRTVLIWVPCIILWTFASLEIFYLINSRNKNVPWNVFNLSKLAITLILGVVCIADFGYAVNLASKEDNVMFNVHYYSPIVLLASLGLAGVFLLLNRAQGMTASGLLFFFWLLLAVCGAVQFRSEVNRASTNDEYKSSYFFISYMVYYPLVVVQFVLHCFADNPPEHTEFPPGENPFPELRSSSLSRLLFSWFAGLAWVGYRKPLVPSDLWTLNEEDSSARVVPKFDKYWHKSVKSRAKKLSSKVDGGASFHKNSGSVEQTPKKPPDASIVWPLALAFGPTFIFGALLKLASDILIFVNPHILELLIGFINNGNESEWKGYLYAALLFIVASLQTVFLTHHFYKMSLIGVRIRTSLISAIYRKSMRLSNASRKESTMGEIVNLMAVDAQRFSNIMLFLNNIWSAPLQFILALYFLWDLLGPSVLAGLAVLIILVPVNSVIANKLKVLQVKQMRNKDDRVKMMSEVLSGIKVLKLFAWEPSFEEQILNIRNKEVQVLKTAAYLTATTSFLMACAPFLVSLVTLGTYVLLDNKNELNANVAFVSLNYFNIIRQPMYLISTLISLLIQAGVSVKRINKFLNCDELNPNDVSHEDSDPNPLVIENGSFAWGPDEPPTLKGINLNIKKGQLAAVVGTVGSGKSSLISAFLGEMEKVNGRVNSKGSLAYVSQLAWIQNATLRDNVLFGKSLENSAYRKIVDACALTPDLEMLPAGDQTEIGEKGINLSGGQKQRVSLARAVYASSDVYFLDDPLSAVDSHVGKHIFENVIGPSGILRHKTRLLVTHSITYLPEVDVIFVMKDGTISETGTYKQLLERKGAFAEFLIAHLQESEDVEDIDLEEIKTELEGAIDEETFRKIQRQVSEAKSDSGSTRRNSSKSSAGHTDQRRQSLEKDGSLKSGFDAQPAIDKIIEVEKIETGSVGWSVYSHYFRSLSHWLTFGTVFMNIVFQAFSIGSNVWLSAWSDASANAVNGTLDHDTRDLYLGVYGALGFGQAISNFLGSLAMAQGSVLSSIYLHNTFLARCMRSPISFFDTTPIGRIINRFTKDVDVVDSDLPTAIRLSLNQFLMVAATVVVVSYSTPIFIAAIIPIGIIYYLIQRFYITTSRQLKRIESASKSPIYSHFGESIAGAQTIRAYSKEQRFIKESEKRVDFNLLCYLPGLASYRWAGVRFEMVGNMIIFLAAMFAVLNRKTMNPGLVGLSVTYALQITQTLNFLVRSMTDVENNIVSVERIKEYSETPQEAAWDKTETKPPKEWPTKGEVEFKNYQVRYREGLELVLKGIDFSVRGGEKVGIVGRTGAGKSSLTLALFRIIEPAAGSIIIDGLDVSKLGLHDLRSRLTIIPQDPVLFSGTIRLNLDPFNHHTDQEVWQAIENAHLKSFVSQLNLGLDHEVSEGGENLSVGQRQLICLGRAILRKTKVLILDEATAAVDLETDDLIQKTIRTEFKDCTILTIAHRLNTILDSDRVLVLDKGLVVEYDNPQTLLSNPKSVFASMAKDAGITMDKKDI